MGRPYFDDDLFRFQTSLSGWPSPIGTDEVTDRTNLFGLDAVRDDHRGEGGVIDGTVDWRHPELRASSVSEHVDHHDPPKVRGFDGADSSIGTCLAGVVAADDDGRGFVGVAPDAGVFASTGDARERPDVLVGTHQAAQDPRDARSIEGLRARLTGGRGGLGRPLRRGRPALADGHLRAHRRHRVDPALAGGRRRLPDVERRHDDVRPRPRLRRAQRPRHAAVRLAGAWLEGGRDARTSANEVTAGADPLAGTPRVFEGMVREAAGFVLGVDPVESFEVEFRAPREMRMEHVALDLELSIEAKTFVADATIAIWG